VSDGKALTLSERTPGQSRIIVMEGDSALDAK
jgi:hypothetical protein